MKTFRSWIESEVLPAFKESHPDIDVEMRYSSGDDREQFVIAHATGTVPDVFSGSMSTIGRWGAPLDRYLMEWDARDDILPALLESGQMEGAQLHIPWSLSLRHFFYRKDMFQEAGLSTEDLPATWEALLDVVPRLIRYDGNNEISQYPMSGADQWLVESLYYQAGGTPYPIVPTEVDWLEYNPALRVYEYLEELYRTSYPLGGPPRFGNASGHFSAGNAAINFNQTSGLVGAFENIDPELIGAFPAFSMDRGSKRVSVVNNIGLAISKDSKHPQAAWELLKFLASTENAGRYNEFQTRVPARRSLLAGDAAFESPIVRLAGPLVEYGIQSFLTEFSGMGPINSLMNNELVAMFAGEKAPASAVEGLRTQIKALQAAAK